MAVKSGSPERVIGGVLVGEQRRIGPAELTDRAGNQRHLRLVVCAGIAGIGDEIADRAVVDRKGVAAVHIRLRSEAINGRLRSIARR